jgi:uncharacterized protein YaaR (DUF327 family)
MKHLFVTVLAVLLSVSYTSGTGNGKHLFILSGQSNMVGLNQKALFTPIMEAEFGKNNIIVVKDAQGGQPILRWYKKWKPAGGDKPETTDDLNDEINKEGKEVKNDLHYTVEGYKILGKRFVGKAIELIRKKNKPGKLDASND